MMMGKPSEADFEPRTTDERTSGIEAIAAHVVRKARGQVFDLKVERDGSQLIIRGRCRTYHAKQIAQQAALEMTTPQTQLINSILIV